MNPYLLIENRVTKLVTQYTEHGSLIIGVDFDFTLYNSITKEYYTDISDLVIEAQKLNCKLCLWTANTKRLDRIQTKCKEHGLIFDYINKSPINLGETTVKPHFNLLLDDVSSLGESVRTLRQVVGILQPQKNLRKQQMINRNNPILDVDMYKLSHKHMYPHGMTSMYSNMTPRSSKHFTFNSSMFDNKVVVFGIQTMVMNLVANWEDNFFSKPLEPILQEYQDVLAACLGVENADTSFWSDLHELGYLPIFIKALPEGTRCPIGVPVLTITNTDDRFAWLVNYLETYLSTNIWKPITMATNSYEYKRVIKKFNKLTADTIDFIPWQVHDFSARGLGNSEEWSTNSIAHLTSFSGTDTAQAILGARYYYSAHLSCGGSVPATEHSVQTININVINGNKLEAEKHYLNKLLTELYPTGIISVVCDSYNFWGVIEHNLPALKDTILARDGKLVIRPDSGVPINVICGSSNSLTVLPDTSFEDLGLLQSLWNIFGGTINYKGYKVLDQHIGIIYGDAITADVYEAILTRMEAMGFSSDNLVVGKGAVGDQYITRDTFGFAIKATHTVVNGKTINVSKDPKTDHSKKSAKGLLCVTPELKLLDCCTEEQEQSGLLTPVFNNGELFNKTTLEEVRNRLNT